MIQSQRWVLHKFLKSNTSTSRDPDALAIVAVEEPANANPEDQNHMEDNVDTDMDGRARSGWSSDQTPETEVPGSSPGWRSRWKVRDGTGQTRIWSPN